MRRVIAATVAVVLAVALTACGVSDPSQPFSVGVNCTIYNSPGPAATSVGHAGVDCPYTPSPSTSQSSSPSPSTSSSPSPSTSKSSTSSSLSPSPSPSQTQSGGQAVGAGLTGAVLTSMPSTIIKTAGTMLKDVEVTGALQIAASNVTLYDVQVDGTIDLAGSPSNTLLEHSSFHDMYSTDGFNGLTIDLSVSLGASGPNAQLTDYGANGKVYPASKLVITNSWFKPPAPTAAGSHMESLHLGGITGVDIENNILDMSAPNSTTAADETSVINIGESFQNPAWCSGVKLINNLLKADSSPPFYLAYVATSDPAVISGNQFVDPSKSSAASIWYPSSAYSPASLPKGGYVVPTGSGNTLNSQPLPLPTK